MSGPTIPIRGQEHHVWWQVAALLEPEQVQLSPRGVRRSPSATVRPARCRSASLTIPREGSGDGLPPGGRAPPHARLTVPMRGQEHDERAVFVVTTTRPTIPTRGQEDDGARPITTVRSCPTIRMKGQEKGILYKRLVFLTGRTIPTWGQEWHRSTMNCAMRSLGPSIPMRGRETPSSVGSTASTWQVNHPYEGSGVLLTLARADDFAGV